MDFSAPTIPALALAVTIIIVLLGSLAFHEFAHAFVANLFGDPTARLEGRLSINPLKHWDPVGTTLLVVLLFLRVFGLNVPVFGWGKPVPVDERNFENPRLYGLQTALAGPMSNFVLALLLAVLARSVALPELLASIISLAVYLNIFLMFFNLLPIPPLDGSRLLRLFLPEQTYYALSNNPFLFFGIFFVVLYFLLDYIAIYSVQLSRLLLGG